jgi:hypothetical protein
MTNELKVKKIKFNGHGIEFYTNAKNQICARHYRILTSGKNKGFEKYIESYIFISEERRNEWATKIVTRVNSIVNAENERKEIKEKAKKEMSNPYKVGQIFYESWGYDQTNVDFYQIIELKNKSVVLKKIAQKIRKGSEGFMSEYVLPFENEFIGDSFLRTINISVNYKGEIEYRVKNGRHLLYEYTNGEQGVYQSHYA